MQCHMMDLGMTWMAANQKLLLGNTQSSKDSMPMSSETCICKALNGKGNLWVWNVLVLCHAAINLHSRCLKTQISFRWYPFYQNYAVI